MAALGVGGLARQVGGIPSLSTPNLERRRSLAVGPDVYWTFTMTCALMPRSIFICRLYRLPRTQRLRK